MKKLKFFALVSFILMCLSITLVSLSISTSQKAEASSIYVGGSNVTYEKICIGPHAIVVARCGNDIEICNLY